MLGKIKRSPLVRIFYKLPGVVALYHLAWAFFGALFYGFPSKRIFVVGVTGTKGKTTTLELLNAILEASGKKTALLSSLREKIGEKTEKNKSGNTMPGRFYIQRFLRQAVSVGCKYALIEVTSQGVVSHRHRFISWNAGILTNIAPEHIESHGSFEKYRGAKLNFLRYVARRKGRVFVNRDDPRSAFFTEALKKFKPVLYSKSDVEAAVSREASGVRSVADRAASDFISSPFNQENIAAAAALAREFGISWGVIGGAIRNFRGVPGRMEFIKRGGITAVVDYAHTPDSLKKVYAFLKESNSKFAYSAEAALALPKPLAQRRSAAKAVQISNSRLICVLGAAGGGRDKWKRPEMGKIAAEYCDEIILTNEDPYDEQPTRILSEIKSGISDSKFPIAKIYEILDRREAIRKAVGLAREGDVVVCTGKGSEDWIHLAKGKKMQWDEKKVAEEALRAKMHQ